MAFIEMSRRPKHGGGSWSFPNCVWSPTVKRDGATWPFWSKITNIKEGDIVLHLRGITPSAFFEGYSYASSDGFETTERPPDPGEWHFSERFYRANLSGFTAFHTPISLTSVFAVQKDALERYFDANKSKTDGKLNLFYVKQANRLQCLNGAYLSDADEELLEALFGNLSLSIRDENPPPMLSVPTRTQLSTVWSRVGQQRFSAAIKSLYGNQCCFPGCSVDDRRFLVGAHIARWADKPELRGNLRNGLCLCLLHDKAFEAGIFTIDEDYRIFASPNAIESESRLLKDIAAAHGKEIRLSSAPPITEALLEHWIRVGLDASRSE